MKPKRMLKGYLLLSILLIADLAVYLADGISLLGQISDKILFWTWLISTPIIIFKYYQKSWAKWYLGSLFILFILNLFLMPLTLITLAWN
ncbi:MAG: hypothetical protein AAF696_32315 [Bacteroidota bacterium]